MSLRDERENKLSEKAWGLGHRFAEMHPFSDFERDTDSERLFVAAQRMGCSALFFDVFKYGAQDFWRKNGEMG